MLPDRIVTTIEDFLRNCRTPALLESGQPPLALAPDRLRLDITKKGAWLEAWDESRVWSRRILSATSPARSKLELEAFRFGKKNLTVSLVDTADARTAPSLEKTRRSAFTSRFRLFLNRNFGFWRWDAFRAEAKLENSWSPIFSSALLTRGNQAVAALAAPPRDTGVHALTFALIWLDYIRRHHGQIAASRLLLYLPEADAGSVICLARHLRSDLCVEIWLYDQSGGEYPLDPADRGNVDSRLAPRYSRIAGPAWWIDLLSRYPELDWVEEPDGALSYRLRGLELARLEASPGNSQPKLTYGRRRPAHPDQAAAIEAHFAEAGRYRDPDAPDRLHALYRAAPERWLESQVRRHLQEIEANLDPGTIYGQCLGSLDGERSALDLLAIDRDGRLNILELKATEDIHLPLQAFDYWLRMRHHLDRGEFAATGYFPSRVISSLPPRVFLVCPALHFHPMTEAVVQFLPSECEIIRIGLNGDWRKRLDVVTRM